MLAVLHFSMYGDVIRTISISAEPLCEALVEGSNQIISYSSNCSVDIGCQATYSCTDNYKLVGGALTRTCSLPRDNIPVWSGLTPTCQAKSKCKILNCSCGSSSKIFGNA